MITYSISNILLKHNIFTRTFQEVRILLKSIIEHLKISNSWDLNYTMVIAFKKKTFENKAFKVEGILYRRVPELYRQSIAFVFLK